MIRTVAICVMGVTYKVYVVDISTGERLRSHTFATRSKAEKAELGILHRIDLDKYSTELLEVPSHD